MLFLAATKPCTLNVYGATLSLEPINQAEVNPAHILVMEGELGRRILKHENNKIKSISFDASLIPGFPKPLPPPNQVPPKSRILIIRAGGIGDVLMSTPAIRQLRQQLGADAHISIACFKWHETLFEKNPDLNEVCSQPLTLGQMLEADFFLIFEDKDGTMARTHMIDFYLKCAGFDPAAVTAKTPVLTPGALFAPDVAAKLEKVSQGFEKTIYLNGLASDRLRDISPQMMSVLPLHFKEHLFVIPKGYADRYTKDGLEIPDTENIYYLDTKDDLAGYVTALEACDVLITTDTSAYHIAAAWQKPTVVFFGSIGSDIRTSYYPEVIAIEAAYQGQTCSAPCGKSMFSEFYEGRTDVSPRCPEAKHLQKFFSPCLDSIAVETIISAFKKALAMKILRGAP
jgi:hypothetical protein